MEAEKIGPEVGSIVSKNGDARGTLFKLVDRDYETGDCVIRDAETGSLQTVDIYELAGVIP